MAGSSTSRPRATADDEADDYDLHMPKIARPPPSPPSYITTSVEEAETESSQIHSRGGVHDALHQLVVEDADLGLFPRFVPINAAEVPVAVSVEAAVVFSAPIRVRIGRGGGVVAHAGAAEVLVAGSGEAAVVFSKKFPLRRCQTVEGKAWVRINAEPDGDGKCEIVIGYDVALVAQACTPSASA